VERLSSCLSVLLVVGAHVHVHLGHAVVVRAHAVHLDHVLVLAHVLVGEGPEVPEAGLLVDAMRQNPLGEIPMPPSN